MSNQDCENCAGFRCPCTCTSDCGRKMANAGFPCPKSEGYAEWLAHREQQIELDMEIERWREQFEAAVKKGTVKVLEPLPMRVRARMWLDRRVNGIGIWLVEHGRTGMAQRFWRINTNKEQK